MEPVRALLLLADSAASAVEEQLQRAAFNVTILRVDQLEDFRAAVVHFDPDVVISAFEFQSFSGLEALSSLHERNAEVPLLFVSDLGIDAAVEAMKAGAADFVPRSTVECLPDAVSEALERRHARRGLSDALRESEERLSQLMRATELVFWMTDADTNQVIYISPAYETVWGRTCASLYARPQTWNDHIHPDDHARVVAAFAADAFAGKYGAEYRILRPDGEVRWIQDRSYVVRDESGKVRRLIGMSEDVTERRQLEEQLKQAQKMEAIGRLVGGLVHEVNNLLTIVGLHTDSMMPGRVTHPDALSDIRMAVRRGTDLTKSLRVFTHNQPQTSDAVLVDSAVAGAVEMTAPLIGDHIDVTTSLLADGAHALIAEGYIAQVIANLVLNARDALPDGGTISIETSKWQDDEGQWVRVAVHDDGIGMSADVKARAFEPFFSTKEAGLGTGLGLALVYAFVRQLSGRVSLESEEGTGTTIYVDLPMAAAPGSTATATTHAGGRNHPRR